MSFRANRSGSIAVIFGVMLVPLLLSAGVAIDYLGAERQRTINQNALDAALMQAVVLNGAGFDDAELTRLLLQHGGSGSARKTGHSEDKSSVKFTAEAKTEHKLAFGGFAGITTAALEVRSGVTAPKRLTEMRVRALRASGWWSKTMTLKYQAEGSATPVALGQVVYRSAFPAAGSGTMTDTFGGQWANLENAEVVWFEMDIDPTSAGLFADSLLHMSTADPATSHYLFVDGSQLPQGVKVNLAAVVKCGEAVEHQWEDGGNFSAQDFYYEVEGKCDLTSKSVPHLTQ